MKNETTRSTQDGAKKEIKNTSLNSITDSVMSLRNLFFNELKRIYWAEKALSDAMQILINNASSEELVKALTTHLGETKEQELTIKNVFEILAEKPEAKKCEITESLINAAEDLIVESEKGMIRDEAIISIAQKIEHHEIASYGVLCAYARTLGEIKVVNLLYSILEEEKAADQQLSEIAESIQMELVEE